MKTILKSEPLSSNCDRQSRVRTVILLSALISIIIGNPTAPKAQDQGAINDLPQALICEKGGVTVVGYLARVEADGTATYMTPNGIFVSVSPEGRVDTRADGTCAGKSLADLSASGQTRPFAR